MAYLTDQNDRMSVCLSVCPSANVLKLYTKRKKTRRTLKLKEEEKREEKKDPISLSCAYKSMTKCKMASIGLNNKCLNRFMAE